MAKYKEGHIYFGTKSPNQKVILVNNVCDEDIITRYNSLKMPLSVDGKANLTLLASDINKLSGNDQDPTCQTILFFAGLLTENKDMATSAYNKITELHERGLYANSKLRNTYSVDTMRDIITSMAQ